MRLGLLPVGELPRGLLQRLGDRLARFGIFGVTLDPIPVPDTMGGPRIGPLQAEALLRLAAEREGTVLAVTDADLCAEGYEVVFGLANIGSPGAVVSMARLRDADSDRVLDRVVKEAVHELGHTWGLSHCTSPACVMHHSATVEDSDVKAERFCRSCGSQVPFGIGKP